MKNIHIIRKVTLVEIRKIDGAMLFKWDKVHPSIGKTLWLQGWNRPDNAEVGMVGKLEYRPTKTYGLWFFVSDNKRGNNKTTIKGD